MDPIERLIKDTKELGEATTSSGVAANIDRILGTEKDVTPDGLSLLKGIETDRTFNESLGEVLEWMEDMQVKLADLVIAADKIIAETDSQTIKQFMWVVRTDNYLHRDNIRKVISHYNKPEDTNTNSIAKLASQ